VVESGPTAGRDDLGRQCDRLQDGGPTARHPRRAWLIGLICADIAVGRDIESDHEHVAATVAGGAPLAADTSYRSPVRRPWRDRQVDLGQAEATRGESLVQRLWKADAELRAFAGPGDLVEDRQRSSVAQVDQVDVVP
jgi:hypothetical protein